MLQECSQVGQGTSPWAGELMILVEHYMYTRSECKMFFRENHIYVDM